MDIGFGSGILLDLVLFADRIIAEPKSNRSILWDMESLQRFERRVCNDLNSRLFLVFKISEYITRVSPTDSSTAT